MPHGYIVQLARDERQRMTPAGQLLWAAVRNKRFHNLKFRREHAMGRYIADFYCAEQRLVLELDGSVHDSVAARAYDAIRDDTMKLYNITVMRFGNEEVLNDLAGVLERIAGQVRPHPAAARLPSPHVWRGVGGEQ